MSAALVRRIVVALDASPDSQAALEEAATLAERLQAELTGIFVLDADLLRLAGLPLAHETGITSARRRTLDPQRMERALRRQADTARRALEEISRQHRLQSSFRLLQGNVVTSLLEVAAEADLLAMGTMGHMLGLGRRLGTTARSMRASSHCSMLLLAEHLPRASVARPVALIYSGSQDSARALDLALELARRRDSSAGHEPALTVLLYGEVSSRPELRQAVQARVTAAAQDATFVEFDPGAVTVLKGWVRAWDGLLVVGHDTGLLNDPDDALTGLGTPILLVRCPAGAGPAEDSPAA